MTKFATFLILAISLISCGSNEISYTKSEKTKWLEIKSKKTILWRAATSPGGECVAEYMVDTKENITTGAIEVFHDKKLTWMWCNDKVGASATDGELVFFQPREKKINNNSYLFVQIIEQDLFRNDVVTCAYLELNSIINREKSNLVKTHSIESHYDSAGGRIFTHLVFNAESPKVDGCYKFIDFY